MKYVTQSSGPIWLVIVSHRQGEEEDLGESFTGSKPLEPNEE